ncbi:zinc-dependent metalloprotease family protein [Blastococcus sp. SYSU D00669]
MLPSPRRPWSRRAVLLAAALALPVVGLPALAQAEDDPAAGGTVVGTLVQAWADPEDPHDESAHGDDALLTWVEPEVGEAVRVPTDDLQRELDDVAVGATVSVTLGDEVEDVAADQQGLDEAREVLAAEVVAPAAPEAPAPTAPAAAVTDWVTVVMMSLPDAAPDARTPEDVRRAVEGPVKEFWAAESNGAVQLGVSATYDWAPATVDCSDPTALWDQAVARTRAAGAEWQRTTGQHLLVYLPQNAPGCSYGLGEIGSGLHSAGRIYVTDTATSVIAHELGHNFGLGHSSGRLCSGAVDTGTCRTVSYRDYYDVMGISWDQVGSLTVGQAARIGLLTPGEQQTVTWGAAPTTVTLSPVSGRTGTRGVRLAGPDGSVYWLEYRPPGGRDGWLGTSANWPRLQSGVLLRQQQGGWNDTSLLFDATPTTSSSDMQVALPVGQTVTLGYGTFRITVAGTPGATATVQVTTGPSLRTWTAATNRLPLANWEVASVSGTTLTLGGWALDPDSPSWSGQVHLYLDGGATVLTADGNRPDVGAAFPQAGNAHGFQWSAQVAPGMHTACLYAIDVQAGWANTPLGCRQLAVGMTPPQANWEVLSVSGTTLSVGGWAFDPDAPTTPTQVHVYVDGAGTALTANGSRPDVGAAFPHAGPAHGFTWSTTLAAGGHTVCAYAIDSQFSWLNTSLGCRQVSVATTRPTANWEAMTTAGTTLSVVGWAVDPDTPTTPTQVHVYVDGAGTALTASGSRPDVGAAFPQWGPDHGFSWSTGVAPGGHTVCAYAIDSHFFWMNTWLGCRQVTVAMTRPSGNWEVASVSGTSLTVAGWAVDPDSATAPAEVHVYVDGAGTALTADRARPDVGAALPQAGPDHGFAWTTTLAPGAHSVCVYAIDREVGWWNTSLGCRTVHV